MAKEAMMRGVNQNENSIVRVFDAYRDAVFVKDVDAFVALYDREVVIFDMWDVWSYNGLAAWREMVKGWFGSLGADRVAVEVDDVQTLVTQDMAMAHALITYKGLSAEGQELRAMQTRLTWVLRPDNGTWKILHEHTSAPVDFDTSKVIKHKS